MRLLPKSEILEAKNLDRKIEIDEGAKLAGKIDLLRKTVAEEEQNLSKFRLESLKTLREEMGALKEQRDDLEKDIEGLKETRKLLQVPLDAEWEEVSNKSDILAEFENSLNAKSLELSIKESEIEQKQKDIREEVQRQEEKGRQIQENLQKSAANQSESENILFIAKADALQKMVRVDQKSQELVSREAFIASRERELEIEREHIENDRKEIIRQNILLRDREGQLEREIKRRK